MVILELALTAYGIIGTTASVISGIDFALKRWSKITVEDIFKKCLDDTLKECASSLVGFTGTHNPKTIRVDTDKLDSIIASLKDTDITELGSLKESERLTKITALFRDCITLPYHQLTDEDLEQKLRPVFEKTIVNFYNQLPFKQEAFNQIVLEFIQRSSANQADAQALLSDLLKKIEHVQLEVQERLIKEMQAVKDDTDVIKETSRANLDVNRKVLDQVAKLTNTVNRHLDISIPDDIEVERQSTINIAKDLLETHQPETAFKLLDTQRKRIWANASTSQKFNILTNMAAAQFALNNEQETARLLLEAFLYNPEEEKALSNCALAHLLLEETGKAADYARRALERNPANVNARVVLIAISADEETLEEVIAKVPECLRKTPQIAYAISDIAKQRGNLEKAREWREIMVEQEEDIPNFKAALATVLIEQILANEFTVFTKQLDDSQKRQLRRAIKLLTEAWNCVVNTELHAVRTDWIINRSMAYRLLGESELGIKDLDAALEIKPSHPILLKNRALLTFEQGKKDSAIEFLEKIESVPEASEAQILIVTILFEDKRFDEAIKRLNDFLTTDPSSKLQEEANRWLARIYIAKKCFEEAEQISKAMCELSPTNILNLVDASRISSATGKRDEALFQLKEAYDYAQSSEEFLEIVELADQLYINKQFKEAATLYEKIADTNQNSELTQWLLKSYYNAGEIGKALGICQKLREKYEGPLENVSKIEYEIYEEIGDLNKALEVCEAYLSTFPDDTDMQMHLAYVHHRLNNFEEFDRLLERSFDLKNLSLQSHFNLAHLHQIGSKPETALEIMYEARRTYFNSADAHLKYFGLFLQVEKQIGGLLHPTQIQSGTAVRFDSSDEKNWYIIEKREDADYRPDELDVEHPLAQLSLGKSVNDKLYLQQNPVSTDVRKIVGIKSKYVYAFQDTFLRFSERFPGTPGLWSIKLPDSHTTDDSAQFQPLLDFIDRQHEATLQIAKVYKENRLPIGALTNLVGGNILDTWGFLMNNPDLGIRCCVGNLEERIQALTSLENSQLKLVVDLISLITLHCLDAADVVVKAFGKLRIAQSTIDELQRIINEREGMWSEREGITVGKQGNQYVKQVINPEDAKHGIEYLKSIIKWIKENCEVEPCTPALEMNQLDKRELNDMLQPFFIDTLLIANQPDYLLLSDDAHLRFDGVWTQIVLEHCVNKGLLDKAEYHKMTVKLVCSHYYHTAFNSDALIEAVKQSDWKPAEPYNSLVQALGDQGASLRSALNVAADFLCELWSQPVLHNRSEYLTQVLLKGLTSGRRTREVLVLLAEQIQERFALYLPVEGRILKQIEAYVQKHPF